MKKILTSLLAAGTVLGFSILPVSAYDDYPDYRDRPGYFTAHPYVKNTLIGGGVGALAGGVLARPGDGRGNALRGALIGGLAGSGYTYLDRNRIFSGGDRYVYSNYPPGHNYPPGRRLGHYKHHHRWR